jgi:hypothetical protein
MAGPQSLPEPANSARPPAELAVSQAAYETYPTDLSPEGVRQILLLHSARNSLIKVEVNLMVRIFQPAPTEMSKCLSKWFWPVRRPSLGLKATPPSRHARNPHTYSR